MAMLNNVQAINDALMYEMGKDESVMVLGEDVGHEGGVFRATTGLQEKYGKARVVDTPLSENGIVGTSIGLALNGMKPVAEIQFSGFAYSAYEELYPMPRGTGSVPSGGFTCHWSSVCPSGAASRRWSTTTRATRQSSSTSRG